jgi:hypothetical protein
MANQTKFDNSHVILQDPVPFTRGLGLGLAAPIPPPPPEVIDRIINQSISKPAIPQNISDTTPINP